MSKLPLVNAKKLRQLQSTKGKGWKHEPIRHGLARKGVKTSSKHSNLTYAQKVEIDRARFGNVDSDNDLPSVFAKSQPLREHHDIQHDIDVDTIISDAKSKDLTRYKVIHPPQKVVMPTKSDVARMDRREKLHQENVKASRNLEKAYYKRIIKGDKPKYQSQHIRKGEIEEINLAGDKGISVKRYRGE